MASAPGEIGTQNHNSSQYCTHDKLCGEDRQQRQLGDISSGCASHAVSDQSSAGHASAKTSLRDQRDLRDDRYGEDRTARETFEECSNVLDNGGGADDPMDSRRQQRRCRLEQDGPRLWSIAERREDAASGGRRREREHLECPAVVGDEVAVAKALARSDELVRIDAKDGADEAI